MGADGATTVRLCGPLGVELAGREVVLPGRQGRLAFAYLVVNRRRAVARDELDRAAVAASACRPIRARR